MNSLQGLGVALVTPFDAHNNIDFEALLKLLKHTATNGVDYWVVMGSTGEAITLSNKEQDEVLAFVKDNNPNNLPVVFGLGGSNTSALIKRLEELDLSGVTAILSSSPAYNKPTQEGIIAHFSLFANKSPVPIILYNVPSRTCSNMEASTTIKLAAHTNIIGIKEASGNLQQAEQIIISTTKDFALISGDDMLTPALIKIGATGLISVLANALPKQFKQLTTLALSGNIAKSQKYVNHLKDLSDLMYLEGNPAGIKELLAQQGICNNFVRLPLVPATKSLQTCIMLSKNKI